MTDRDRVIRVGTRGSKLAMVQTGLVIARLGKRYPDYTFETVEITTKGDRERIKPIYEFGGKAVFVEDIEKAITDGVIDMAVHSAKDMPNPCGDGLGIAGVLERGNPRDVLIYRRSNPIAGDGKAVIGTSSLRRQYQLKELLPNASCRNLRGNIGTRIEKLRSGEYDAVILAAAGIERQGLDRENDLIYRELDTAVMLPAAGQAVIAVEAAKGTPAYAMAEGISDADAMYALTAERRVLEELGASCHEPVGVYVTVDGSTVSIELMRLAEGRVDRRHISGDKELCEELIHKICRD